MFQHNILNVNVNFFFIFLAVQYAAHFARTKILPDWAEF
jgi:hypothetical protein